MKILFDASAMFASTRGGGIYNYLVKLLPRLARLTENNGHDFRHFHLSFRGTSSSNGLIPDEKVIRIRFPVKLMNRLWLDFSLPDLSWFWKDIDIFHSPHFSLPVISKAKKILTVNDIAYLKYPQYYAESGKKLNEYGYKKLLPVNIKRADKIIAISQHTKEDIVEHFKIPQEDIAVIHIGCSISQPIPPDKLNAIISRFGLNDSEFIYFPVGTLEPRKNLERTVEAFKKAKSYNSRLKLVISGVGDISWLDGRILNDDIIFVRWNSEEERDALYQSAIFAIYPSLYEGFGIPALEAMSNAKALLTSNTSSLPEIANGYAHMVNPNNADEIADGIQALVKDEKYRKSLEKKSLIRAKDFSFDEMARKTYEIYQYLN